jgi:glycosyltransferase involved in cell wall biosynthesis
MRGPLVSIVIDNFNYERFLRRSIDSALGQTYPRVEVVVVDDASSDGSAAVIRKYGDRVVPVIQRRNRGQGAALQAGVAASHGDVVLFLDSDDWLYPQAAARVAAAFAPGVAQIQYRLHLVGPDGVRLDTYPPPEVAFDEGDVVPLLLERGRYETTVTSGTAFSRAVLDAILPIPELEFRISADGYLVTVAPLHGRVVAIDEPLGAYVQHGANLWSGASSAERFRKALAHDHHRYAALRRFAAARGLKVVEEPGLRDHAHLSTRLSSLVLEPAAHPERRDRRSALALRGAWASRGARLPAGRRAALALWFLAGGLLPRGAARRVVAWRLVQGSRPAGVARALRVLRRVLR